MKKLILHDWHQKAGARFFPFGNWLLPKNYRSVADELRLAREVVALHDASYNGHLFLKGAVVTDFLQRISTNDLSQLEASGYLPTLFCNTHGRLIDYVHLIHFSEGKLAISCHPEATLLKEWIARFILMEEVEINEPGDDFILLMICGPAVQRVLRAFCGQELQADEEFLILEQGDPFVAVIRNKFSKWPAFDLLFCGNNKIGRIEQLLQIVKDFGGDWFGKLASEVLRIESGIPAGKTEINEQFNPHEARLLHAVSFTKGSYTGQEVIACLDTYDKVQKYLMVVELHEAVKELLPAEVYLEEQPIGYLTSYAFDAHLKKHVGLAYIKKNYAIEDFNLMVHCGIAKTPATLHLPPWVNDWSV